VTYDERKSALIRAFRYSVNVPTEEESDRVMECVQMLSRELSLDEIEEALAVANVELDLDLA
jgi:hypothetical protein